MLGLCVVRDEAGSKLQVVCVGEGVEEMDGEGPELSGRERRYRRRGGWR